jgi:hypothetical protein
MDIKILGGLALVAFLTHLTWNVLVKDPQKKQQKARRRFLVSFQVTVTLPYFEFLFIAKDNILAKFDLNYLLGQLCGHYKGTDWADGILSATIVFTYMGIIIGTWSKEIKQTNKKPDKKEEEDKPFKIEARIGNIKEPKKEAAG